MLFESVTGTREARFLVLSIHADSDLDRRLRTQSVGGSKKTALPFSRTVGQSVNCHEQLHPNITRFTGNAIGLQRRCFRLIGSPVLNARCTSPNCNLCPWLHTDCRTVIKPSWVRLGDCDSMSRKSGSVKHFMMTRALARRPDCMLSSGFQSMSPRSIYRTIWPTHSSLSRFFRRHLRRLILEQGLPLSIHALQELTSFSRCQLAHFYFLRQARL